MACRCKARFSVYDFWPDFALSGYNSIHTGIFHELNVVVLECLRKLSTLAAKDSKSQIFFLSQSMTYDTHLNNIALHESHR